MKATSVIRTHTTAAKDIPLHTTAPTTPMARLGNPPNKQATYLGRGVKPLPAVPQQGSATSNKSRQVSPHGSRSSTPRRSLPQSPTPPPAAKSSDPRQLFQQCLPLHTLANKLSGPTTASPSPAVAPTRSLLGGTPPMPSVELVKRPNGTTAHLLKLPPTVPYVLHMHDKGHHVHVVPCFTPAAAQQIRLDAEAAAKRLGGWAPRAVGCCTNDVLVSQLGATSQQLIFDAFRRVIMPYACRFFPNANLTPESLPKNPECFFLIKYSGDRSRKEFGEHTDHTKLTINISLTNPVADHSAGGLFLPVPKGILDVEVATPRPGAGVKDGASGTTLATSVMSALGSATRSAADAVAGALNGNSSSSGNTTGTLHARDSRGVMLRPRAGTCMMHHGDVRHAGDRIESGERIQLVAFFYGSEKRGQALPLASPKSSPFDVPLSISTPPTSDEIIAASWPKGAPRDPQGKPLSLSSSYSSNSSAASTASASSASSAASAATVATAATAAAVASFNSHQSQLLQLSQATGQRAVGLIERAMLEAQRDITLAEVAKLAQA